MIYRAKNRRGGAEGETEGVPAGRELKRGFERTRRGGKAREGAVGPQSFGVFLQKGQKQDFVLIIRNCRFVLREWSDVQVDSR